MCFGQNSFDDGGPSAEEDALDSFSVVPPVVVLDSLEGATVCADDFVGVGGSTGVSLVHCQKQT